MILIHAPYPYSSHTYSGMMLRVKSIDAVLIDLERIYFWESNSLTGDIQVQHIDSLCAYIQYNPLQLSHRSYLYELAAKADMVYAHSAVSSFYILDLYDSNKVITDLHGLAPEECALTGNVELSLFYEKHEHIIIKKSRLLVAVTEEMAMHYMLKYGIERSKFLVIPIITGDLPCIDKDTEEVDKVVYAGDISAWQNIHLMFDVMKETLSKYDYHLFSGNKDDMKRLAAECGVPNIKVSYFENDKKENIYRRFSFGIVFRNDNKVNRVACPTKLVEYMQYGVVPVVLCEKLGDFTSMGYGYILLDDFINKNFTFTQIRAIQEKNAAVFMKLKDKYDKNSLILKSLSYQSSSFKMQSHYDFLMLAGTSITLVVYYQDRQVYRTFNCGTFFQHIEFRPDFPCKGIGIFKNDGLEYVSVNVICKTNDGYENKLSNCIIKENLYYYDCSDVYNIELFLISLKLIILSDKKNNIKPSYLQKLLYILKNPSIVGSSSAVGALLKVLLRKIRKHPIMSSPIIFGDKFYK